MASIGQSKTKVREEDLEALFGVQTGEWGGNRSNSHRNHDGYMSMSAGLGGNAEYSGFDGDDIVSDDLSDFESVSPVYSHGTHAVARTSGSVPGFNRVPSGVGSAHASNSIRNGNTNMNWGDDSDDDDLSELDDMPGVSNPKEYVSVKPAQMRQTGARYNASASVSPSVSVRRNGILEAAGSTGFTAFANGLVTMMTAFFVSVMPVILLDTVAQPIAIMLMVHPLNLIWLPYAIVMTIVGLRLSSLIFGTPIWDDLTTDRKEAARRFKKETERKEHEFESD